MRFNLSPFDDVFNETTPSFETWRERIRTFFSNENFESHMLDEYYDALILDIHTLPDLIKNGVLTDPYTGLFTLNTPSMAGIHTFNLADYIRRNHNHFTGKKIFTVCQDYGILNIQTKLCGLDLVHATIPSKNKAGSMLVVIGNQSYPYTVRRKSLQFDVVFASNIFDERPQDIWYTMLNYKQQGKEIYFTTADFSRLQGVVDFDRLELALNPSDVYDKETYADLDLGFMYRIYKVK